MKTLKLFTRFATDSARAVSRGNRLYWAWVSLLLVLIGAGVIAYVHQSRTGLITTNMRDQVSWAFYIGNFTFLVGVAAAAVLLVIPAYVYEWKPIKEVVILGELLAISAITMCGLFVTVDVGHPERLWHLMPGLGHLNVPRSMLAWDVLVLNGYLVLNVIIVTYLLFSLHAGRAPNKKIFLPLVLLSIPAAIGIHTVTAFLYSGLPARPFWNTSILVPRFLASAFCSGPAVLIVLMQILRRFTRFEIQNEAIWKVAELMSYAMGVNLILLGAEVFKDYYSNTEHLIHMRYMFQGVDGHTAIVPCMWLVGVLLDHGLPALPRAEDAPQPDLAQRRLRADLDRRLPREGHGARDPGPDARHAGRDLRVLPLADRAVGRRGHLLRSASWSSRCW